LVKFLTSVKTVSKKTVSVEKVSAFGFSLMFSSESEQAAKKHKKAYK